MSALKISFNEIMATLHKAGINEDEYQWLGFLEGAIAKGLEPGSATLSKHISDLLNGGQPLPGSLSAFLTSLAIEIANKFTKSDNDLFFFPCDEENLVKLRCLADLCSGLCLGLGLSPQEGMVKKINSQALTDFIKILGNIADVDLNDASDPEDLKYVLEYISTEIRNIYKENH